MGARPLCMGWLGAGLLAAAIAAGQGLESPVSIGFLIDNGASMRDQERMVRAAVRGLLDTPRPEDEAFVMNFASETYIDADFTGDAAKLAKAADRIDFHHFSAVWDAVEQSILHLERSGKRERKILMVVTAGDDGGSHGSFDQLLQQARQSGVVVYAVGLIGGEARRDAQAARRTLTALAEASGGRVFFPKNLDQVEDATARIAREIRGDSAN